MVILIAIVAPMLQGIDWLYALQWLVCRVLGVDALLGFTEYGITLPRMAIEWLACVPFGAAAMLVALHLAPGRRRVAMGLLIVAWALAAPRLWYPLLQACDQSGVVIFGDGGLTASVLLDLVSLGGLALIARSWKLAAIVAGELTLTWVFLFQRGPNAAWTGSELLMVSAGFQIVFALTLMVWAIRRRRKGFLLLATGCRSCGYDKSGLTAMKCPECGERALRWLWRQTAARESHRLVRT